MVHFLGAVALVAVILVAWFLGALLIGLAVGRVLGAMGRGSSRPARRDYDQAA